jgi:predicted kinase
VKKNPKAPVPLLPPRLILVMGVAGSGKSEIAKAILEQIWAVYLDNNFLADAFSPDSRTDEHYLAVREKLYAALYRITRENLRIGNSVLLDAPHIRQVQEPEWCLWIQGLAKDAGAWMRAIRCRCGDEILRRRLEARGEKRDRWILQNWQTFLEEQSPRAPIPFSHLELDTEQPLKENVARSVSYILKEGEHEQDQSR